MAKATATVVEESIANIQTANCPSLSGKSTLEYAIGTDANSAIHFKVTSNSGSGYFTPEWIALAEIERVFGNMLQVTAYPLHCLFKGKSNNNAGFLFAVLKAVDIVKVDPENPRRYLKGDMAAFKASLGQATEEDSKGKRTRKSAS